MLNATWHQQTASSLEDVATKREVRESSYSEPGYRSQHIKSIKHSLCNVLVSFHCPLSQQLSHKWVTSWMSSCEVHSLLNGNGYIYMLHKKHFAKSAKISHVGMHFHGKTLPQKPMKQAQCMHRLPTHHSAMHLPRNYHPYIFPTTPTTIM